VELRPGSEMLPEFVHPDWCDGLMRGHQKPVYVFGPEDGSLPGHILKRCHRFVCIPSFECLNLSTAVATVLYDRMTKMPAAARPTVRDRGVRSVPDVLATSSHY
jgi:tRNA C32,U32 (ribose-2'-O)-methylase TrmJ